MTADHDRGRRVSDVTSDNGSATVYWEQKDTFGKAILGMAAWSQKLELFWDGVRDVPHFADATAPLVASALQRMLERLAVPPSAPAPHSHAGCGIQKIRWTGRYVVAFTTLKRYSLPAKGPLPLLKGPPPHPGTPTDSFPSAPALWPKWDSDEQVSHLDWAY